MSEDPAQGALSCFSVLGTLGWPGWTRLAMPRGEGKGPEHYGQMWPLQPSAPHGLQFRDCAKMPWLWEKLVRLPILSLDF